MACIGHQGGEVGDVAAVQQIVGDAWQTGGGSTWLTGSFDPELDLLYWTVGNPAPDWNGDVRPGDNLYSCSIIALRPDTGELQWHFQFTPHDTHDWDANQIPVLFDAEFNDEDRKIVALANRNAFFYLLDRETGEFLQGNEYSKQTWATGLDENGRPLVIPGSEPTYEDNLVWPSLQGATNWFSPSYNPVTGQFFVATRLMGAIYYKSDVEYEEGEPFLGGGEQALSGDDASGDPSLGVKARSRRGACTPRRACTSQTASPSRSLQSRGSSRLRASPCVCLSCVTLKVLGRDVIAKKSARGCRMSGGAPSKLLQFLAAGAIVAVSSWDVHRKIRANSVPVTAEQWEDINQWKRDQKREIEQGRSFRVLEYLSKGGGGEEEG